MTAQETGPEHQMAEDDLNILLALYRQMLLIRRSEEQMARAHQMGLIHGACHTYVGQEAIATAVCAHLRPDDAVFSTHRGHGHALAKGVSPHEVIAELFGRASGCSQGRGGSMHLFKPEIGLMGTSGIVGPCILQATGAGYSFKLLKSDNIGVAFFGDGAVNNGAFHEGLNLASIWKLPVLFVCENNQYATEVAFAYAAGNPTVGNRGPSYGMESITLDGNDVLAIYQAAAQAVQRARSGEGPTLIECRTYRTRAHAEGMRDAGYRTPEEVEEWKTRDPITCFQQWLVDKQKAAPETLQAIEAEIKALVDEATEFARESPWPQPSTAMDHIFTPVNAATPAQVLAPATTAQRSLTFVDATREALDSAMDRDSSIFVVGEGIGERGGNFNTTSGLYRKYGAERLRDTPISERGFVGMCAGAAMTGTRPIVDFMFVDFILDAFGELVNQIAKMQYMSSGRLKMPLILRGAIGIGHAAATHHSGSYYPIFAHLPGLRVVVPSIPSDAKGLFTTALRGDDPVLFLEHKSLLFQKGAVPAGDYAIPFGQARMARAGTDCTIVAIGSMVSKTLDVCDRLAPEGISAEVIDPRTIAPLDMATILESVHKTGRLLVVDETFQPCGVGAEISAQVIDQGFDDLDAPIRRLNGAHVPTPYSPPLEGAIVPQEGDIEQSIRDLLAE